MQRYSCRASGSSGRGDTWVAAACWSRTGSSACSGANSCCSRSLLTSGSNGWARISQGLRCWASAAASWVACSRRRPIRLSKAGAKMLKSLRRLASCQMALPRDWAWAIWATSWGSRQRWRFSSSRSSCRLRRTAAGLLSCSSASAASTRSAYAGLLWRSCSWLASRASCSPRHSAPAAGITVFWS